MYIITFYSYKGGVGRTMALVNVAAELVRRGRKVLVVDFDLEAPGLETYERLRSKQPHAGMVEFVTQFMRTRQAPDVRDFLYPTEPIGTKGGQLWVMPAGRRDSAYREALVNLSWKRLYHDFMGFEFFEDTKKQWEEDLKPDYVLIDSRTGETDVLGICTRQLPDTVVVLFIPDEQNLAGLEPVCRRIRREETEGLQKKIPLHFVASNVPDLDDGDRVLRRRLEPFHNNLSIEKLDAVIHRCESALLFNQPVFVIDRPRSRLAREYQRLRRALILNNPADREGALLSLRRYAERYLPSVARDIGGEVSRRLGVHESRSYEFEQVSSPPREPEDLLDQIAEHFLDDADIFVKIAECRTLRGEFERSIRLLDRAIQLDANHPHALFRRALCRKQLHDAEGASEDLFNLLRIHGLENEQVVSALRVLKAVAPARLLEAPDLPAVQSLAGGELREACDLLADSKEGVLCAIRLMRRFLDQYPQFTPAFLHSYLIRAGQWREVIESLESKNGELGSGDLFELAIAYWGETGSLRADLCRLALERDKGRRLLSHGAKISLIVWGVDAGPGHPLVHFDGADWLLLWGAGRGLEVLPLLDKAVEEVNQWRRRPFSIWRFREVLPSEFLEDCQQIRRMIQGEPLRPEFLGPAPAP